MEVWLPMAVAVVDWAQAWLVLQQLRPLLRRVHLPLPSPRLLLRLQALHHFQLQLLQRAWTLITTMKSVLRGSVMMMMMKMKMTP